MPRILLMSVLVGVVACQREEPAATAAKKPTDETVPARTMPAPTPSTKKTTTTTTTTMDARAQAALDMSLAMLMKDQMLLHENLRRAAEERKPAKQTRAPTVRAEENQVALDV